MPTRGLLFLCYFEGLKKVLDTREEWFVKVNKSDPIHSHLTLCLTSLGSMFRVTVVHNLLQFGEYLPEVKS